jgi:5-formyltetrahydrofolate cyclo-ligase
LARPPAGAGRGGRFSGAFGALAGTQEIVITLQDAAVEAPVERGAIMSWRRTRRAELLAARMSMPLDAHARDSAGIMAHLEAGFGSLGAEVVGLYWPFRREINPLPFAERVVGSGGEIALPVVVAKGQPLQFRLWSQGDRMERGAYDIPYPAAGKPVDPEVLVVALVGFDGAGYRLGYGGGYYDRTLSVARPRPLTVGIGFETQKLDTIHPLAHDIPMDFIVTEAGIFQRRPSGLTAI